MLQVQTCLYGLSDNLIAPVTNITRIPKHRDGIEMLRERVLEVIIMSQLTLHQCARSSIPATDCTYKLVSQSMLPLAGYQVKYAWSQPWVTPLSNK